MTAKHTDQSIPAPAGDGTTAELLAEAVAILRQCEAMWGCECPYCDRDFGDDFDSHEAACRLRVFLDRASEVC